MMLFKYRWILLPLFILPLLTQANLLKVDDRGDAVPSTGGTTTLRQAIALAAPGDTVLISVNGTIQLNSPLLVNKAIRIMGPYPIHSTIDVKGNYIQVGTTADTLHFSGVKITSTVSTSTAAIRVLSGSKLLVKDCLFKGISNTSGANDGGAVEVNGLLVAKNCSFINNSVQQNGGAISVASGAQALLTNCTLSGNSSSGSGGAIYNGEDVRLLHCTFRNNAALSGRHIYAVSILLFTAHTEFQNCLFHQASPSGSELQGGLLGGWVSNGGNVYTFLLGSLLTFTPASDQVNVSAASVSLETTATIDGYGLEYFRLTSSTSIAVENGITSGPLSLPTTDARRAPRILDAGTAGATAPDAGAVEFTPYTVNNTGTSAATVGTFPYQLTQIQSTANPAPYYIEFAFSSPVIVTGIAPASTLTKSNVFIDGYSCRGSMVPGPGVSLASVTPALTGYEMSGTGPGDLLQFSGNNVRVQGLGFTNSNRAIAASASASVVVQGNVFNNLSTAGLSFTNVTQVLVGGNFHHQRNVFKNGEKGIDLTGGGPVKIQGNFIGTDETGMNDGGAVNQTGIYLSGITSAVEIGGDRYRGEGNLLSGLGGNGISLDNTNGVRIYGNTIGQNFPLTLALPNSQNGIRIGAGSSNVKIGHITMAADSNIIAGNVMNGILVESNATNVDIIRNQLRDNGQLGISLGYTAGAALPNDVNDADGAAVYGNAGQNYPEITAAYNCGSSTTVSGKVNVDVASGSQQYRLDFYAIPVGSPVDASGHGEGNKYLGSIYQTPSVNPFIFSYTPTVALPLGTVIAATCSKENGVNNYATSEFSDTALVRLPQTVLLDTLGLITCYGGNTGGLEAIPLGASPFTYDWYMDNALMSDETNSQIMGVTAGAYHAVIQDGSGCMLYTDTVQLLEPAALNRSITVTNETCAGDQDGSISVTVNTGGTPGFSIVVYDASANVMGTYAGVVYGTAVLATSLSPGNYSVVITDANLCKDSTVVTVGASPNSVTAAFSGPANICEGGVAGFNDLSSGSPSITSWSWNFGDGNMGSGVTVNNTYLTPGTYTVQLIADNGVCDDTTTASITVDALPVINAGTDFTICSSSATANLSGSASGATAINWISFTGAGIVPPTAVNPTYTFNATDQSNGYATAVMTGVNGACTVTDTVVITIDEQPAAALGTDQSECSSTPVSLTVITGTGNLNWTTTGTGSFSAPTAPATNYDASGDGGGTVTVTLTASSVLGACTPVSDNLDLIVSQGPSANAGSNYAVCYGSGITNVTGTAANYTSLNWTVLSGTGSISGAGSLTPVYTFGTGDEGNTVKLLLEAYNPPCASAKDTITITIDAIPQVNAGPDKSVCSGNVSMLTGTVVSATTQTWTATGGGIFTDPSASMGTYTSGLTSGNDTLTLTTGTNGACAAQDDFLVLTVDATPIADAGTHAPVCPGTTVALDGTGSLYAASYDWTEAGVSFSTTATATANPAATTSYILTVTNVGCTDADTITIATINLPDASFSYPASAFCSNEGLQTPNPVTTGGTYSLVSGTLDVNATTGILDPVSAAGTFGIIYTLSTPCSNADTITITINAAPTANAGTDQTICPGTNVNLDGTASTGAINYNWKEISPGSGSVGTTASVNVVPLVTTTYSLIVDNGSCTDADTIQVIANTIPDASFTYPASSFCVNDGLQAASPVKTGGTWSVLTGGLSVDPATGELDPSSATGTFDVVYTLASPCLNADTVNITVYGLPLVNLTASPTDHSVCVDDTILFSGAPAGGNFVSLVGLNASTGEYIAPSAVTGIQVIAYDYTDANGCTANDTFQVIVNQLPVVNFTGLAGSYCPADGPVTLVGSPAGGSFFLDGTATGGSPYNYDPTIVGTDSITYYYVDATSGCASYSYQLTTVVAVPATPVLTSAAPYAFCAANPQNLVVSNPDVTVSWYSDAGLSNLVTTGPDCSSSLLEDGAGMVYVVNKTGSGCASTPLSVNYINHTFTGVQVGGPYTTCQGEPVNLQLQVPAGIQAAWYPHADIADTSAQQPVVYPVQTSTYVVQFSVMTLPSCTLDDSVEVTIDDCSLENIANAFSPNGDGINDVWIIKGIAAHPGNKVSVLNRWGDVLVKLEGYNNTTVVWDGRYKNERVGAGTYYYVIEYPGTGQQSSGWVQVQY